MFFKCCINIILNFFTIHFWVIRSGRFKQFQTYLENDDSGAIIQQRLSFNDYIEVFLTTCQYKKEFDTTTRAGFISREVPGTLGIFAIFLPKTGEDQTMKSYHQSAEL